MTDKDKLDLMINLSAQFLDGIEAILSEAEMSGEEKTDFYVNILSFVRCLFVHASHEKMSLKNNVKWETLRAIQDTDMAHMKSLIKQNRLEYNH